MTIISSPHLRFKQKPINFPNIRARQEHISYGGQRKPLIFGMKFMEESFGGVLNEWLGNDHSFNTS